MKAVGDEQFDASSSLREALWGVLKEKISGPLSHILVISDVWRVSDAAQAALWCGFVRQHCQSGFLISGNTALPVEIPFGFHLSSQPFGRLLHSLDSHVVGRLQVDENHPAMALLNFIGEFPYETARGLKEAYFLDWCLLRSPPHLHTTVRRLPVKRLSYLMKKLFEDPAVFFAEWGLYEANVIAALELLGVAAFAKGEEIDWDDASSGQIRNWKMLTEYAARQCLKQLSSTQVVEDRPKFIQAISSVEINQALCDLVKRQPEDIAEMWLYLSITQRIVLFYPDCHIRPQPRDIAGTKLIKEIKKLAFDVVIRPRFAVGGKPMGHLLDTEAMLRSTASANSAEELFQMMRKCPQTGNLVPAGDCIGLVRCPRCDGPLEVDNATHLTAADRGKVDELFRDYRLFQYFFERVAELFIRLRSTSKDARYLHDFLKGLINETTMQVSWHFMTAIVRVIEDIGGSNVELIDAVIAAVKCNRQSEIKPNAISLLRALVSCAGQVVDAGIIFY